ncbi:MAG: hypothetical protein ACI9TV_003180, partial [Sulfurimonas sp.]
FYMIDKSRYTKRIKSRNLLKFLQTNGYPNFTSDYKFITLSAMPIINYAINL